jgi:uncharacterized membrane protein YbhN (UPF0104 family)
MAMSYDTAWSGKLFQAISVFVGSTAAGVVVFYSYLFLMKEDHDILLKFLKRCEGFHERFASITRVYLGIRHYHNHRGTVTLAMIISIVIHILVAAACIMFAQALSENLPPLAQGVVIPLGLLVAAVPIMPGGIGTGHAAFSFFYALLGSQRGADVFSLYVLFKLLEGGLGGLVYLGFRAKEPLPEDLESFSEKALD